MESDGFSSGGFLMRFTISYCLAPFCCFHPHVRIVAEELVTDIHQADLGKGINLKITLTSSEITFFTTIVFY